MGVLQDQCKICFDEYPVREMRSAACNHRFCRTCWKGYISTKIGEGPAVLNMRCPLPDCRAAVCLCYASVPSPPLLDLIVGIFARRPSASETWTLLQTSRKSSLCQCPRTIVDLVCTY